MNLEFTVNTAELGLRKTVLESIAQQITAIGDTESQTVSKPQEEREGSAEDRSVGRGFAEDKAVQALAEWVERNALGRNGIYAEVATALYPVLEEAEEALSRCLRECDESKPIRKHTHLHECVAKKALKKIRGLTGGKP